MSIQMDGQYVNERFTQETEQHGFAGVERVERHREESGFAAMDGELINYVCECGERFDSHDELNYHIADMNAAQASHANTRFLIVALLGGL